MLTSQSKMQLNWTAIQLILAAILQTTSSIDYGLKWGEKCKIPDQKDFLKPSEECEMSKGLHCQVYQQGILCGCLIRSSLSWDENAGECRRKPGHHCPFINSTEEKAYNHLPYNHKCHINAECKPVPPIPEIESTDQKKQKKKTEQYATCQCKPGYKANREGLTCYNVNASKSLKNTIMLTLLSSVLVLLT